MKTRWLRLPSAFCNLEYLVAITILVVLASLALNLINRISRRDQQGQPAKIPVQVKDAEKNQH